MYSRRTVAPLKIDTRPHTEGKAGVFTAAAFHVTEQPSATPSRRRQSTNRRPSESAARAATTSPRRQRSGSQAAPARMNYQSAPPAPTMFVRAMYDYEADDRTSLSFKQGDIIQVITQLESGWWDGIINDVRGWFPSNYCSVVPGPADGDGGSAAPSGDEQSGESGTEDEPDERQGQAAANGQERHDTATANAQPSQEEEAAFWIPQATADGRLYYYNTLTGVSTVDLPLETPTRINENGPRDRMNVRAPDQTRPPPEMMARGGLERDEDETSSSEIDGDSMAQSHSSLRRKRGSQFSDGVSPAASMESLNASPVVRSRNDSKDSSYVRQGQNGAPAAIYPGSLLSQYPSSAVPRSFYDDGSSPPTTWNRLIDNMRKAVEAYRQAINNADRSEYVRRAEDISDHLRMILAAGSGTTDNHSGNPSVISTNKALYPHFRDMMSRFSKLVLSSHMAAADWPAPDSYAKCLQEAEGVLHGVYGFVDVARAQRGEEIPRLVPGFVLGSYTGGSWMNNNLSGRERASSGANSNERESFSEPAAKLDAAILERMDDLKRMIVSSIRRLEEHLVVQDKVVNSVRHEQISNVICTAAGKVVEYFRPYIATVESINLSQPGRNTQSASVQDFTAQKQRLYDLIAGLVVACQTVAGPLSDEWAEVRGEPLANRVQEVQNVTKQLESSMSQIGFLFQQMLKTSGSDAAPKRALDVARAASEDSGHGRSQSQVVQQPPQPTRLGEIGHSLSYNEPMEVNEQHRRNPKVGKFFGEIPAGKDDTPSFLRLEYEGDIAYDNKTDPPQLKGGTLIALVEQLTRHDRMDPHFNNTFLLTYRSFTTATELFDLLVKRFSIQPPARISQEDYKTWVEKKQRLIRIRVVNILRSWFDTYWMENNDETSAELLKSVHSFVKNSVATTNASLSEPLLNVVEQRLRGQDVNSKRLVINMNTQPLPPIIPKNMKKMKFLDIDVTEFARQLTILESKLYGKIKPSECLNKTWQKKLVPDESDPAPNVKAVILHSNQLTNWVAEMILAHADVKRRVIVIKQFVNIADVSIHKCFLQGVSNFTQKCRALNNFSTLTSIVSALGTAPINRLSRTWQQVNARTQQTLETLRSLISSNKNFVEYREALHNANPPCIPFLGKWRRANFFLHH